jgi:hypothetical protein
MHYERFKRPHVSVKFRLGSDFEDKPFELLEEVAYCSFYTEPTWTVIPAGFRTDFASIPRFFWRLFPPFGKYAGAAIVHDWHCDNRTVDYRTAAKIFLEVMEDLRVNKIVRALMYRAVLWFGPRF